MKCAYCGKETNCTKEHIISSSILDLFPECYITYDGNRNNLYQADPVIKDVCATCNKHRISYIDSYAKRFIGKYFTCNYSEKDNVEIEYNYTLIQKMLLKYAYNDLRSNKEDCSFFDEEILHYILNESDDSPKLNVTVLCGLAVNDSPVPDEMFGNLKIRWCQNPIFFSDSVVKYINYETGAFELSDNNAALIQSFDDLKLSYVFKFNSVQFLLMCWEKDSNKIIKNNLILSQYYPYHLMKINERNAEIPVCTNEMNYFMFNQIHVKWDELFIVQLMRKRACGGKYTFKEMSHKEWEKEEEQLRKKHPRKRNHKK